MELLDLHPAGVGESPGLVELLASELHQVLVDDVPDVLQIADDGDEADLLAAEIGAHRVASQARQEQLDLPLQEVDLVIPPLHVLQQLVVAAGEDDRHVAQHALDDVGHTERLAGRLAQRQRRLIERPLVEVARAEGVLALLVVGHQGLDRAGGQRRER